MDNRFYEMVGALPMVFALEKRPQAHGYTIVEVTGDNPYFKKGSTMRGHEFHYSRLVEFKGADRTSMVFTLKRGKGIRNGMDGITYKNVFASYTHLHAIGAPEWTQGVMSVAARFRENRK